MTPDMEKRLEEISSAHEGDEDAWKYERGDLLAMVDSLREELKRLETEQAEWREARNYCGSCGKTMSEAGFCNPCSKRAGNRATELMERKDKAEHAARRLERERDSLRAQVERLKHALVLFRDERGPGFFHDCACGDCSKCLFGLEALGLPTKTEETP